MEKIEETKRKTILEMFKEIKDLEVADSPLMTVEDCLPFMCEKVEQALTEKQDLEKFTRLVVEKNVDMYELQECEYAEQYNKKCDYWGIRLTQEEFDLAREMIMKYGKRI